MRYLQFLLSCRRRYHEGHIYRRRTYFGCLPSDLLKMVAHYIEPPRCPSTTLVWAQVAIHPDYYHDFLARLPSEVHHLQTVASSAWPYHNFYIFEMTEENWGSFKSRTGSNGAHSFKLIKRNNYLLPVPWKIHPNGRVQMYFERY